MSLQTLVLRQPDDFHVHLRDGDALKTTVLHAAQQFARITVMPNLSPAISQTEMALAYQQRVLKHVPTGVAFSPLMSLYLTAELTIDEVRRAQQAGIQLIKYYPQGVTTNSQQGVSSLAAFDDIFAEMADKDMLLLVHGEVADLEVDIFARESQFLTHVLQPLMKRHPRLRIVLEHITTRQSVNFVRQAGDRLAATITPQHLLANRNHLLSGGIKPHYYCLPILKTEDDRRALLEAATSGEGRFFLGSDSAPHVTVAKESACGCAGCYSMPYALEYYAEAFEQAGKLAQLEDFAARFGADFYGLPRNQGQIELVRKSQIIAQQFPYQDSYITPFMAGQTLNWTLTHQVQS